MTRCSNIGIDVRNSARSHFCRCTEILKTDALFHRGKVDLVLEASAQTSIVSITLLSLCLLGQEALGVSNEQEEVSADTWQRSSMCIEMIPHII